MKRISIARLTGACGAAFALSGCGGVLLPAQHEIQTSSFQSYKAVRDAFDQIKPMKTSLNELSGLGFDVQNGSNAQSLSYLDVENHFVPNSSVALDRLDPAVEACIMAGADCQGYEFKLKLKNIDGSGSLFLDLFDFAHTRTETGWNARVLFLIQDGHVTYKLLSGEPHVQVVRKNIKPLGPAQDLGGVAVGSDPAAATIGLH